MNMTKIAKLAGCSLSTVSKAFRNSPEISAETRDRIFEIAKQNNCFQKYYSPIYKKKVFAVICKELLNSVYGNIVDALNVKIAAKGDMLLISNCNFVQSTCDELLDYYINFHHVDGIIIIAEKINEIDFAQNIPLVMIRSSVLPSPRPCDSIETSDLLAIDQCISHLKKMGHEKIAYIGEYLSSRKQNFFVDALKKCELEINENWLITSAKRKGEAGFDAMDRLLSLSNRPTAIFAAYDAIAFGAMSRIHKAGLRVPDDFSIISCNDIPLSAFTSPPLSTVSTPIDAVAEAALSLLYRRLETPGAPFQTISIQNELILRESVARIK